jgi:hypothetical protein
MADELRVFGSKYLRGEHEARLEVIQTTIRISDIFVAPRTHHESTEDAGV